MAALSWITGVDGHSNLWCDCRSGGVEYRGNALGSTVPGYVLRHATLQKGSAASPLSGTSAFNIMRAVDSAATGRVESRAPCRRAVPVRLHPGRDLTRGAARPAGTRRTAGNPTTYSMYKLERTADSELKALVGKRVEATAGSMPNRAMQQVAASQRRDQPERSRHWPRPYQSSGT